MVTMPETAVHSMVRMEPSSAQIVLRVLGEKSWTTWGGRRRLSLVSERISERNSKDVKGLSTGEGEAGSARREVLVLEMALANSLLPGGMGGIADIRRGVRFCRPEVSRKQGGQV